MTIAYKVALGNAIAEKRHRSAWRETAKELNLKSPFEANAPVHLRYSTDLRKTQVAAE
jgi:hypothetical protein